MCCGICIVKSKLHPPDTPTYRGFGDTTLQDQINLRSLQQLTNYFTRFKERFGSASKLHNIIMYSLCCDDHYLFQGSVLTKKCQKATQLLEQLRTQVHTRKDKNVDILSLSQEVSYF